MHLNNVLNNDLSTILLSVRWKCLQLLSFQLHDEKQNFSQRYFTSRFSLNTQKVPKQFEYLFLSASLKFFNLTVKYMSLA